MSTKVKSVLGKRLRGDEGEDQAESEDESFSEGRLSDESETDSDEAEEFEEDLDLPTCAEALKQPLFEDGNGDQGCCICPAKQIKKGSKPEQHTGSKACTPSHHRSTSTDENIHRVI